jgi:hypothetical protein
VSFRLDAASRFQAELLQESIKLAPRGFPELVEVVPRWHELRKVGAN